MSGVKSEQFSLHQGREVTAFYTSQRAIRHVAEKVLYNAYFSFYQFNWVDTFSILYYIWHARKSRYERLRDCLTEIEKEKDKIIFPCSVYLHFAFAISL